MKSKLYLGNTFLFLSMIGVAIALDSHDAQANHVIPHEPSSRIKHLVVIIQENQSFDHYFGRYCIANTGTNPTCNDGPACCEAAPITDPGSGQPMILFTQKLQTSYDPNHSQKCMIKEMHGGLMDRYITEKSCGNPNNFSYIEPQVINPYWEWARQYSLADRYFQPVAGASAANNMYFARARFVFKDNTVEPDSIGSLCSYNAIHRSHFNDTTIGDLLRDAGVSWSFYAEGYADMLQAQKYFTCPRVPTDCASRSPFYPCIYEPSDNPFAYYPNFQDKPEFMKDRKQFSTDLLSGKLPAVSFVKALGYKSEHPGLSIRTKDGVKFVVDLVTEILDSPEGKDTLILLTFDESGGFFDHISPPPNSEVDGQPYGPRVPMLAIGEFARKNFVSHVTMEHSSVVKFIEWNWLGQQTGQLGNRDGVVNNLGSLLDPSKTGVLVPVH